MTAPAPKSTPFLTRLLNRQMMGKLAVISICMFGFGYAMVPIYKAICEATGVNSLFNKDKGNAEFAKNTQVDLTRKVVVDFDANSRGSWLFRPEKASMTVHPGELITVNYDLISTFDKATIGQAIPSYAPLHAGQYFRKLECFCFKQQALGAQQVRRFPVVFVVDPKLPKDVTTITLSYTFFEIAGANAASSEVTAGATPLKALQ
jgi:cytochrome c oxidase assembly protein subunit 11